MGLIWSALRRLLLYYSPTQQILNFKTFCCNLKTRGLGMAKLCVAFLLFFLKDIITF